MENRGINRHLFLLFVSLSILCLLFVINRKSLAAGAPDLNFYYYSGGGRITLPLSKEVVALRFKPAVTLEQQRIMLESEKHLAMFSERKDILLFKLILLPLRPGVTEENVIQTIHSLNTRSEVQFASPIFHFPDAELILTDEFIVKFDPSVSEAEINAFNTLNDVEIVRKPEWADWYVLRVKHATDMNTLKTGNLYYENPITIFSMPNFVRRLERMTVTPNDTYFAKQWHLNNTGQDPPGGTADADIDAPEGWEISTGSSNIVIAIIDEGVDLAHVDLDDKLVAGKDFTTDPPDDDPSPWGDDAHGTACGGLAASETNNETGVAGVGWNCKIMPIRIASGDPEVGDPWTTEEWAANGIAWAANNGADVLSNSWGGGPDSDTIHDAIIDAKSNGRNGRGCVIVFASGNAGGAVAYPARYEEVIAVGATDEDDTIWWYSNHGNELDVVAPSGNINLQGNIWTTDITGNAGYNNRDPLILDYTDKFGGTSAAAPQVAGLAALILSVNPDFTSNEVQYIIECTADDKGNEGWDAFYGWGRINVESALIEAANFSVEDKLAHWWKLDEVQGQTASDSAGDSDGKLGNDPDNPDAQDPVWVNAWINGGLDFDDFEGGNDYVDLGTLEALKGRVVSISAWIKVDDVSALYSPIVRQYDFEAPHYFGYDLCLGSGWPLFYLDDTRAEAADQIDNEWHHLAGTYDSQELRIYVDGVLKDTTPYAGENDRDTEAHAYIGWGTVNGDNKYFNGIIDDVRVYNWGVNVDEILDKMYYGTKKFAVLNESGVRVAWFDNLGNVFLKGELENNSDFDPPTGHDEFKFKDSSNNLLMVIDTTNGNMYIKGSYTEDDWPGPGPEGEVDEFIIEDSAGPVAYINESGDLYLKGELYQNPEP